MISTVNLAKGPVEVNTLCGHDKVTGQPAYFAQSSEDQNHYYRVWSDEVGIWHCECDAGKKSHRECRHIKAVKLVALAVYRAKQSIVGQAEEVVKSAIEYRELEEEVEHLKDLYRDAAEERCYGEMELLESSILWRERRLEEIEEKRRKTRARTIQNVAA